MSFRLFIYYCALCGGAAALVGWVLGRLLAGDHPVGGSGIKGMGLGMLVALALGTVDALWSYSAWQVFRIFPRVVLAVLVGTVGGLLGGTLGQVLADRFVHSAFVVFGWTLTGLMIGVSIGAFDFLARFIRQEDLRGPRRKLVNGLIGGTVGGLLGGILTLQLRIAWTSVFHSKPSDELWSPSAMGFVALGACIGLMIGLAQVLLRESWLRVERGFRAGRELLLTKPEVTIGRAEGCDIGLFGDPTVERLHARLVRQGDQYVLEDAGTNAGTFLNDQRVSRPTPLRTGDAIRVGRNVLRFGERQKRT